MVSGGPAVAGERGKKKNRGEPTGAAAAAFDGATGN